MCHPTDPQCCTFHSCVWQMFAKSDSYNLTRFRLCSCKWERQRELWVWFQNGNENVSPLGHGCVSNNISSSLWIKISQKDWLWMPGVMNKWFPPHFGAHRGGGAGEEEADWQECVMLFMEIGRICSCLNEQADAQHSAECLQMWDCWSESWHPHFDSTGALEF